jgi:uncharacterized cofD-like protein
MPGLHHILDDSRQLGAVHRAGAREPQGQGPRIVAVGGGTGLPVLLRGLGAALFPRGSASFPARDRDRLTAVVAVSDDGGSSGRLREAYGVLAPGDIRNCLLALSDPEAPLATLFGFRFDGTGEIAGHSLGNLILTALARLEPDFSTAVDRGARLLGSRGRVLPATLANVRLRALLVDGRWVEGESRIVRAGAPIQRVALVPETAPGLPAAIAALGSADLVVLGPGSLFTSLLPPLLVRDVAAAIARSRARVVLIANLMTEPGETDGFSVADHLAVLRGHVPDLTIHDVILNSAPLEPDNVARYAARGAAPIPPDPVGVAAFGSRVIRGEILASGEHIRHDPDRLAALVLSLADGKGT